MAANGDSSKVSEVALLEAVRTLAHHVAMIEAKQWSTMTFLAEKGVATGADYEAWMKAHQSDVAEIQNVYLGRIATSLKERGVI